MPAAGIKAFNVHLPIWENDPAHGPFDCVGVLYDT